MKMVLPANLPVTFFPTPGDDNRTAFPLMEKVSQISDDRGNVIDVLTDGRIMEFRHSNDSKAIISINDILSEVIKSTFYKVHPETGQPK